MDEKLNYYNVKYLVLNNGKFYTLGKKMVLGLSEEHARENFIPELLNDVNQKVKYRGYCGLHGNLEVRIKSVKKFDGFMTNIDHSRFIN